MKTLATYKANYKRAKTQIGKKNSMNKAMLNLSHSNKEEFLKWQIEEMNK